MVKTGTDNSFDDPTRVLRCVRFVVTRMADHSATRRMVLRGAAAGVIMGGAGCLGNSDEPTTDADQYAPVALDDEQTCDNCGMTIDNHAGPSGQTFFEGDSPPDRDGPAWYCSSLCTYAHRFDHEEEGDEPSATFLTDYSAVTYEISDGNGASFLSAHNEATAFVDASTCSLVAGPDVLGAMGPALVPFSDRDDAGAFADDHGGDVIDHDDVDRELVMAFMQ